MDIRFKKQRMARIDFDPPRVVPDDMRHILPLLQAFIANPNATVVNEPKLCKTAPIDFDDLMLELLPELNLDSELPTAEELERAVDDTARDLAAFLVKAGKEDRITIYHADD